MSIQDIDNFFIDLGFKKESDGVYSILDIVGQKLIFKVYNGLAEAVATIDDLSKPLFRYMEVSCVEDLQQLLFKNRYTKVFVTDFKKAK